MLLKDLIYSTEWLSVQYVLIDLYPKVKDQIEEYRRIFNELNKIQPIKSNIVLEMDRQLGRRRRNKLL